MMPSVVSYDHEGILAHSLKCKLHRRCTVLWTYTPKHLPKAYKFILLYGCVSPHSMLCRYQDVRIFLPFLTHDLHIFLVDGHPLSKELLAWVLCAVAQEESTLALRLTILKPVNQAVFSKWFMNTLNFHSLFSWMRCWSMLCQYVQKFSSKFLDLMYSHNWKISKHHHI